MFLIVYLGLGTPPSKEDCTKQESFEEALGLLQAPEPWVQATKAFLKEHYADMSDVTVIAICAYIRFLGVAEFGYERKVFDRPFWILPSTAEMQQEVGY
jgi:hypothetical protein